MKIDNVLKIKSEKRQLLMLQKIFAIWLSLFIFIYLCLGFTESFVFCIESNGHIKIKQSLTQHCFQAENIKFQSDKKKIFTIKDYCAFCIDIPILNVGLISYLHLIQYVPLFKNHMAESTSFSSTVIHAFTNIPKNTLQLPTKLNLALVLICSVILLI